MIDTNALRKKVLDLAIRGKLVPQNPADEPASVLLERIREEKQRLIREGKIKKDKVDSIIFRGEDNCHYEKIGNSEPVLLEDLPFDIPTNWSWVKISGLFVLQTGASFKKETAMADKSQTRVLRGGNIQRGTYSFLDNDIFIKDELVSPSIYLRKNDLITPAVTSLENIGKIARITEDYDKITVGGFVFILRGFYNNDVLAKYLYYAIQSDYFTETLKYITKASGSAFFNINKDRFLQLLLPIPTENEQLKIISFLDEVFAYISFIEQNQSDYNSLVETLKKAILQSAIQGKLVEQDDADESASELLAKIRAEKKAQLGKKYVESYIYQGSDNRYYEKIGTKEPILLENLPFEIPSSWSWARLGTIIDFSKSVTVKVDEIEDDDWVLDLEDIEKDTGNVLVKKTMLETKSKSDKHKFFTGNVLYSKLRPYLNKVLVAEEDGYCTTEILAFDFGRNIVNHYARYFLMSTYFLEYATNGALGDMPRIRSAAGNNGLMPIPPYNEQIRICTRIKQIFDSIKDEG